MDELRKEIRAIERKWSPVQPYGKWKRKWWFRCSEPRYYPNRHNPEYVIDITL